MSSNWTYNYYKGKFAGRKFRLERFADKYGSIKESAYFDKITTDNNASDRQALKLLKGTL